MAALLPPSWAFRIYLKSTYPSRRGKFHLPMSGGRQHPNTRDSGYKATACRGGNSPMLPGKYFGLPESDVIEEIVSITDLEPGQLCQNCCLAFTVITTEAALALIQELRDADSA